MCVCPQGGRGVCLSACWDTPQEQAPPRPGTTPPDQAPPPRPDTPPDQTPPRPGTRLEQTHPREADCSIRLTSGRYASYWNAFLLSLPGRIQDSPTRGHQHTNLPGFPWSVGGAPPGSATGLCYLIPGHVPTTDYNRHRVYFTHHFKIAVFLSATTFIFLTLCEQIHGNIVIPFFK